MKRRQLIKTTTYGAAAATTASLVACSGNATNTATTAGATEASNENLPEINWQMATSWPASLDTILGGATTFAERVSAMSSGRFTITP
ncbi:MAG TPA: hypothetical protein V6D06_01950, partial [Trichocoleus sp.]